MKITYKKMALFAAAIIGFPMLAPAAVTFNPDDLVLGVQATGGTGSTTNLFFNLGSTTGLLANGNQGYLGNINADMTATYGNGWFDRSDVWFGAAGNRSNLSPAMDPGVAGQEPGRTWYVSSAAALGPASAMLRTTISSAGLGSGATYFAGLKSSIASLPETSFGAGVVSLSQAGNPVEWNNSWSVWNPTPGAGFGIWNGGIQNHFGADDDIVWIDIQRLAPGETTSYVTSIGIGRDGSIYAVPEPSSALLFAGAIGALAIRRRRAIA